jgi:mRNA interferase RelE/StbE
MKTAFKKSFLKEVKKNTDKKLKDSIADVIEQVEAAENLSQVKNLKKLEGFDIYYRIRIGNYRVGLQIKDNLAYFIMFDHRKDIYRNFP